MKKFVKYLVLAIGLMLLPSMLMAQSKVQLDILTTTGEDARPQLKKYKLKKDYNSFNAVKADLQKVIDAMRTDGYFESSMDSLVRMDSTHVRAVFYIGKRYDWVSLSPGNADEDVINAVAYREKFFDGTKFNFQQTNQLLESMLEYCENHGYPFAVAKLDSIKINDGAVTASLFLQKNQLITYDTLIIEGDAKISKGYLYNYLGIKKGSPYNESTIKKVSKRIKELTFLTETDPLKIVFLEDKAKVYLYLESKKASQFDFLIGILPNNEVTGRVLINGDAKLHLENPFGTGKIIGLNWRKLQAGTQDLDLLFEYPYLIGLPIGADLKFDLYKRDTLYLDVNYDIGLKYLFIGRNYMKVFVENRLTNLLNVDTTEVIDKRALPSNSDVRNTLYGLEYFVEKLDYRFNPRSGWVFKLKAAVGTKRIKENNTIAAIEDPENPGSTFQTIYDSLDLRTVQYRTEYQVDRYWPIGRRATIKTGVKGGLLFGPDIFQNELYRIGGTRTLRGFDEEDIFASMYHVATFEFRFLLSQNSYFSVFGDAAYTQNRAANSFDDDFPYGFGAGLTFETKGGIFGVSYALGSQQGNAIDFKSAKIHFGYFNYF